MDSLLYAILDSVLRNLFVSPVWIRQTDNQWHGSPFRHAHSFINNACFPAFSPSSQRLPSPTIMAKQKATAEELEARAESNGYKRGAHREEDSTRDDMKYNDDTKKQQKRMLNRYIMLIM
jgi:hypothetical protein